MSMIGSVVHVIARNNVKTHCRRKSKDKPRTDHISFHHPIFSLMSPHFPRASPSRRVLRRPDCCSSLAYDLEAVT